MKELTEFWSKRAYNAFRRHNTLNLYTTSKSNAKLKVEYNYSSEEVIKQLRHHMFRKINSFSELARIVAFLGCANRRTPLYFRGQRDMRPPIPVIYRPEWRPLHQEKSCKIKCPGCYFTHLNVFRDSIYSILQNLGIIRQSTLFDIREAFWAVAQHYGIWPTPLIDVTTDLRVAASFAIGNGGSGYLMVFGLPSATASITYEGDDQLVLARLSSILPPSATRAHLQIGFLVGRHPLYALDGKVDHNSYVQRSNLVSRLIAAIPLIDKGTFFSKSHPKLEMTHLMPDDGDDPVLRDVRQRFGRGGIDDLFREHLSVIEERPCLHGSVFERHKRPERQSADHAIS